MTVLGNIKLKCISVLELLKRLGQRLVSPLNKRKRMKSTEDMTGKHGREEKLCNVRQCLSGRIPASDIIQRRTISCPSMPLLYDQMGEDGVGTVPGEAGDLMSATTLKIQQERRKSLGKALISEGEDLKMLEKNSIFNGAGARKTEEEDSAIQKNQTVKRKISNALSVGIMGAKIASLFFTISSLIYSTTYESEDLDEDIDEI